LVFGHIAKSTMAVVVEQRILGFDIIALPMTVMWHP